MAEYQKPLPEVNEMNQEFWDACKRHEFRLHKCQSCGEYYWPQAICVKCDSSKMEWVVAIGKGRVHTFNVYHQLYHPGFKDDIPYNTVVIELDEGPLFQSNIVQCRNEDIRCDMPVEVTFEDVTDEVTLPKFRPAAVTDIC